MGWISVKDKFPSYGKYILISNGESISFGYYDDEKKTWEIFATTGKPFYKNIKYWMPLPEPPKE